MASPDSLLSPVVPQVVKCCADFLEKHGVVDGIYRLSGISSNIQKLRFVPFFAHYLDWKFNPNIQNLSRIKCLYTYCPKCVFELLLLKPIKYSLIQALQL